MLIMLSYVKQMKSNQNEEIQYFLRLIRSLIGIFFGVDFDLLKGNSLANLLEIKLTDKMDNQSFINDL